MSQVWLDLKIPDFMSEITRLVQTPGSEIAERSTLKITVAKKPKEEEN